MAGITQTISSYSGGISEQPDQLKSPGQVKDAINVIPDLTWGLYKRPGSQRVGTNALTNVQSGGSFFHYYRDEAEGSYIGQIADDGRVRMWSCKDGTEKNVWYATDNSAFNGGTGSHVSIKNYCTPSTVSGVVQREDIQTLTVNDSTFINNRTKTVSSTGTTDGYVDAHFAFVELQKTENGRQYGINIYDSDSTTNIARATRIKHNGTNQDTGVWTGHCPGIGTQVFKVDSGSAKNLIFRVTTLGQQGPSTEMNINSDDANQQGNDYRCVYSNKAELLHGGEGWSTGDVPSVTMTSALTDYTHTINIEKIETVSVKANIKAVRPEPTPFDADTAVSADSILGGIQAELSGTGISYKVIGNGLYLSKSSAFNVEVVDKDLMRAMGKEVNDVSLLPNQCRHGYIVKVVNSQQSNDDDYYLKFKGDNDKDGTGSWIECPAPGIVKSFDASTMPHVIQRQADGDFLIKQYDWADREVGDNITNAIPSFVGKTINRVLFFRNRLVFLSGENVCTSRAAKYGNFWADTALAVSAIDPIDITSSSTFPSELFDGIELGPGLLVFSTNQQFLFAADAEILNPDTAKFRPVSTYNYNKVVPPIALGQTIAFLDNSGKYSRFMEAANIGREADSQVAEQSKLVPSLLPKDIDLLTNSRENSTVLFAKSDTNIVYGFKYFNIGQQRQQSSWFKWKLNRELRYHFCVNDDYYFLDGDNFLQKISLVQSDDDPSITQDETNYQIHLDNWVKLDEGVYDNSTNLTTFTNKATWIPSVTNPNNTNGTLVVIDTNSNSARVARYAVPTLLGNNPNDDFTLPGDWSAGGSNTFHIGYLYDYQVDLPRIYATKQTQDGVVSDVNASLILHRIKLNFGKIGLYDTTLKRVGKDDYNEIYESAMLPSYNADDAPYLDQDTRTVPVYDKNENVNIILKSTHPAPATLFSMSWEGDYSNRFYTRA